MISELVKELRAAADWDDAPWWWDCPNKTGFDFPKLHREAADEIEGLIAWRARAVAFLTYLKHEHDKHPGQTIDIYAWEGEIVARVAFLLESVPKRPDSAGNRPERA